MRDFLGAIIGDVVGSKYEFHNHRSKKFELFDKDMFFTDDTVMTLAVMDILLNKKDVVKTMQEWGNKYPNVSWGASFGLWLKEKKPQPYWSYGNGAAMRISPVGWIAKDEDEVMKLSNRITNVSHDHPEGMWGAYITALCVFYARKGKSKDFIKKVAERYYDLDFDYEELRKTYYFNETCQNTVPQAIYCFLISKSFEDCLRISVSIGGDTDTLCAISCAIASAYYGIPKNIEQKINSYLDDDMLNLIERFEETLNANKTE